VLLLWMVGDQQSVRLHKAPFQYTSCDEETIARKGIRKCVLRNCTYVRL